MSRVVNPPVKCGYCGWLIGGCENIISHKCLEDYDEENHFLNVDDNFVVTMISRQHNYTIPAVVQGTAKSVEQATDDASDTNEIDEKLIQAVRDRPALYDFRIPVKERSKLKKDALWCEVSNVLGGVMNSQAVQKRWQYLRDCFNEAKKKMLKYIPSGSAAEVATDKTSFRFYNQMSFICDSLPSAGTVSNVQVPLKSSDSGCCAFSMTTEITPQMLSSGSSSRTSSSHLDSLSVGADSDLLASPQPPPRTPTPGGKRQKTSVDRNADLRSALVTALQEPIPQTDAVDGFLARLGEGLRRLPYRERSQLEIKFLSLLMEVEDRLHSRFLLQ